jgi:putative copper export protein/mono/diheme cytochrome c family protein
MPTALIAARAFNLICAVVLVGVPAVLAIAVLPPMAGRAAVVAGRLSRLLGMLRPLLWAAVAGELTSGALWFVLQAAAISGQSVGEAATANILGAVLWQTQFGQVMLLRLILAIAFALCLVLLHRAWAQRSQIPLLQAASVIAAASFISLAWTGHAAATPGVVHLAADATHLLAAGLWLGGLVALAALFAVTGSKADGTWLTIVAEGTRRFSLLGMIAVGALLVTGIINSWFLVGTIPALVGTDYGHLLLAKIALFGAMVLLAAINRGRLTPRIAGSNAGRRAGDALSALRVLRRNALLEAGLGAVVLFIVSALGAVPPGLHDQPWWPFDFRLSSEAMALPDVRDEIVVAAQAIGLGVALCLVGAVWRRQRVLAMLVGLGLIVCFAPSLRVLAVTAYPTSFYRSPVAYTTASIARGARLYAENCTQCHGLRGKGDGPAATGLKVPPADLTAAHVLDHSEGDTFWWLSKGIPESGMPGFAERLSEDERWDLINWVRTLPVGGLDEGLVTEVGTGPAPRAPDFSYVDAEGKEGSLQAMLTHGPVLLVLFTPSDSETRLQRLAAAEKALADAGLGILALPLTESVTSAGKDPPFVATADASVALAYRLLAAVPRYDLAMSTSHLEFLIDRSGYVRALWLPQETAAWEDVRSLVTLVGQLAKRPLAPYSAAAHIH